MPSKYMIPRTNGEGYTEEFGVVTPSAPATDQAGRIVALNNAGYVDPTLLNAATTGNDKVLLTDSTGRLNVAVMPVGYGQDANQDVAGEALSAGDFVYFSATGVRKADGATGKKAQGFVLANVANGQPATVLQEGTNTGLTGLTKGSPIWLSTTTPGGWTQTRPTGAGKTLQTLGSVVSATALNFQMGDPVLLIS